MEEKSKMDCKVDSIRNSHFRTGAWKITFIYLYISRELKSYMKNNEFFELFLKVNVAVIYKDLITAADFYFYTLLNKSSLNFENKGKWKRPGSCVSKEVLYSLSANLQYLYHYKRVNEPKLFRNSSRPWNSLWSRKRRKIFSDRDI